METEDSIREVERAHRVALPGARRLREALVGRAPPARGLRRREVGRGPGASSRRGVPRRRSTRRVARSPRRAAPGSDRPRRRRRTGSASHRPARPALSQRRGPRPPPAARSPRLRSRPGLASSSASAAARRGPRPGGPPAGRPRPLSSRSPTSSPLRRTETTGSAIITACATSTSYSARNVVVRAPPRMVLRPMGPAAMSDGWPVKRSSSEAASTAERREAHSRRDEVHRKLDDLDLRGIVREGPERADGARARSCARSFPVTRIRPLNRSIASTADSGSASIARSTASSTVCRSSATSSGSGTSYESGSRSSCFAVVIGSPMSTPGSPVSRASGSSGRRTSGRSRPRPGRAESRPPGWRRRGRERGGA